MVKRESKAKTKAIFRLLADRLRRKQQQEEAENDQVCENASKSDRLPIEDCREPSGDNSRSKDETSMNERESYLDGQDGRNDKEEQKGKSGDFVSKKKEESTMDPSHDEGRAPKKKDAVARLYNLIKEASEQRRDSSTKDEADDITNSVELPVIIVSDTNALPPKKLRVIKCPQRPDQPFAEDLSTLDSRNGGDADHNSVMGNISKMFSFLSTPNDERYNKARGDEVDEIEETDSVVDIPSFFSYLLSCFVSTNEKCYENRNCNEGESVVSVESSNHCDDESGPSHVHERIASDENVVYAAQAVQELGEAWKVTLSRMEDVHLKSKADVGNVKEQELVNPVEEAIVPVIESVRTDVESPESVEEFTDAARQEPHSDGIKPEPELCKSELSNGNECDTKGDNPTTSMILPSSNSGDEPSSGIETSVDVLPTEESEALATGARTVTPDTNLAVQSTTVVLSDENRNAGLTSDLVKIESKASSSSRISSAERDGEDAKSTGSRHSNLSTPRRSIIPEYDNICSKTSSACPVKFSFASAIRSFGSKVGADDDASSSASKDSRRSKGSVRPSETLRRCGSIASKISRASSSKSSLKTGKSQNDEAKVDLTCNHITKEKHDTDASEQQVITQSSMQSGREGSSGTKDSTLESYLLGYFVAQLAFQSRSSKEFLSTEESQKPLGPLSSTSLLDIFSLIKNQAAPRIEKGYLTHIIKAFAEKACSVDREALRKGYLECLSEKPRSIAAPHQSVDSSSSSTSEAEEEHAGSKIGRNAQSSVSSTPEIHLSRRGVSASRECSASVGSSKRLDVTNAQVIETAKSVSLEQPNDSKLFSRISPGPTKSTRSTSKPPLPPKRVDSDQQKIKKSFNRSNDLLLDCLECPILFGGGIKENDVKDELEVLASAVEHSIAEMQHSVNKNDISDRSRAEESSISSKDGDDLLDFSNVESWINFLIDGSDDADDETSCRGDETEESDESGDYEDRRRRRRQRGRRTFRYPNRRKSKTAKKYQY